MQGRQTYAVRVVSVTFIGLTLEARMVAACERFMSAESFAEAGLAHLDCSQVYRQINSRDMRVLQLPDLPSQLASDAWLAWQLCRLACVARLAPEMLDTESERLEWVVP